MKAVRWILIVAMFVALIGAGLAEAARKRPKKPRVYALYDPYASRKNVLFARKVQYLREHDWRHIVEVPKTVVEGLYGRRMKEGFLYRVDSLKLKVVYRRR